MCVNIGVIVSNAIAFLAFVTAVVVGVRSTRRDDASDRRAEAAAQRAVAADERQQAIVDAQHQTNTRQHENNLLLTQILTRLTSAEASVAEASTRQLEVEWAVENTRKNTWLLRNLGAGVATSVLLDQEALGGIRVDLTPDLPADIGPGESLSIRAFAAWGHPVADEVRVTWGEGREQVIPLPRWF